MPIRGTFAAHQVELHDVEEFAVARIDLHFSVAKNVVGAAQARCDLLAPSELNRLEGSRIVRRIALLIETDAKIERQPRVSYRPRVLNIKRLLFSIRETGGGGRQTADIEVTILALTESTRIRRLYRRARCRTR